MTIHEAIQHARTSAGLSEQELAVKLGYKGKTAYSSVVKYETGERTPGADLIARIADATGFFIGTYQSEWEVVIDVNKTDAIDQIIDDAERLHPYKQKGKSETYSMYNEGWSDACDYLEQKIKSIL